MLVDVKTEDSPYKGLWLHEKCYVLGEEIFTSELKKKTLSQTGLKSIDGGDWWSLVKGGNSELSWKQLIQLSLKILNSDLTKTLCNSMWLEEIPTDELKDITPIELPNHSILKAKKINTTCSWYDENARKEIMLEKFKMFGKEMSAPAEGTWLHWVSFATQILNNTNTGKCCLRLQCVELVFRMD